MATPNSGGKNASSRLLTMKFMQRAAGSSPAGSPSSTKSGHSAKRQRLSDGSRVDTQSSEARIVADALAAEELKRSQALDRQAAAAGETKWVLSYKAPKPDVIGPRMRIITAGFSTIDSAARTETEDSDEEEEQGVQGRRSFGVPAKPASKANNEDGSSANEESDDAGSDDEPDDPTGAKALIAESRKQVAREERNAKKKADQAEANRMASQRRGKGVNLNRSSGISAGGRGTPSGSPGMTCYGCGEVGHQRSQCPRSQRKTQYSRDRA